MVDKAKIVSEVRQALRKSEKYDAILSVLKPNVKLSAAGRNFIRDMKKAGEKQADVARMLCIAPAAVSRYYNE